MSSKEISPKSAKPSHCKQYLRRATIILSDTDASKEHNRRRKKFFAESRKSPAHAEMSHHSGRSSACGLFKRRIVANSQDDLVVTGYSVCRQRRFERMV